MSQAKSLKEILKPKTSFNKTYIRIQAYFTFFNLIYAIVGKIPKIVFWLTCGTLAGYLVVLQFLKYFENADTPKISFKTLNESPEGKDVYPDITFCFTEYRSGDHIYNCSYLQEHHSLSACQYQNLLLGESTAWSTIPNPGRVADVNFEEASMDLKELIPQHKVQKSETDTTGLIF